MDIQALEQWYQKHQRLLPFRTSRNPYHIWISEIMAQQTQMETVVSYFVRFIEKYPTVFDLASADEESLHKLLEGIGYYRRFQYMQKAAKLIVLNYQGRFPDTYEQVRELPGVGDYTAGAIMSIAYQKPYAATDGNVVRVLSRYLGIDEDMKDAKSRKKIDVINQAYIKDAHPEVYTQAMMELGALICKPVKPLCENCPLREGCFAFHNGKTADLPVISRKTVTKIRQFVVVILRNNHQIAVAKNEDGLLKGMYLYPQFENMNIEEVILQLTSYGYTVEQVQYHKAYKHIFTHQKWQMKVYQIDVTNVPNESHYSFVDDVHSVPMAIAHRKIKLAE